MRKFLGVAVALIAAFAALVVLRPQNFPWAQAYVPQSVKALAGKSASGTAPKADGAAAQNGGKGQGGGGRSRSGPIAISVATADIGDIPLIERTYGTAQALATVQISARISSQVMQIHVKDGQRVTAGDLLMTLDDRALQAQYAKDQAVLAKDQATQLSAAADLARAKTLAASKAGTQQAYDQALAANNAALATIEADKATIAADEVQLSYTKVTAPLDGRLGEIAVSVGDIVTANSSNSLLTITQTSPLRVETQLPERLLASIRGDGSDGATLRAFQTGTTNVLGEGKVDFINSSVDSASGTIRIAATVANADGKLWPGQHVDVEVKHGVLSDVVVVPTVAIQQAQQGAFVWLLKPDQTVEARNVVVARNEANRTAVSDGLAKGDQVVVEGQLKLAPGSKVKVAPQRAVAEGDSQQAASP